MLNGAEKQDSRSEGEALWATFESEAMPHAPGLFRVDCLYTIGWLSISCFRTERHAVFIVSDLPEGENLELARALEPSVYAHITGIESVL